MTGKARGKEEELSNINCIKNYYAYSSMLLNILSTNTRTVHEFCRKKHKQSAYVRMFYNKGKVALSQA